jgi:hypothetical protein
MNMSVDKAFNHQCSKAGSAILLIVKNYEADCLKLHLEIEFLSQGKRNIKVLLFDLQLLFFV